MAGKRTSSRRPASVAPQPTPRLPPAPTDAAIATAKLLLEPWQRLTSPSFDHPERVPVRRPFLLVGNHTLMGVLDVPLMVLGLHERRGVMVRSLGDHLHFRVPLWRDLLSAFGTVEGTPDNCRALMQAREPILVFPGGGREVFKHKGERYRLIWKQRYGFVRLAIEFGYPIIPFAAVGAEECYDIVFDSVELRQSPFGRWIEAVAPRPDEIPPIVRGLGPLPRPQRFYFWFGPSIETESLAGLQGDEPTCLTLRARVQHSINQGIAFLLAKRARDPDRNLPVRLIRQIIGQPAEDSRGTKARRSGAAKQRRPS